MKARVRQLLASPCAVVGVGISNCPLIDFLLSCGLEVTARDRKEEGELGTLPEELRQKGVRCIFGSNYLEDLREPTVFRSPGLRPDVPPLQRARENGACILSEMELFMTLTPAYVLGVTGSDGKTTTTTLVGKLLEEECRRSGKGRVFVGGNIGEPLLRWVEQMTAEDYAVVELSSFQLMDMRHSPHRAAMTNLSENHLNWHVDMAEYGQAKTNIFRHASNEMLVTNGENKAVRELAKACRAPVTLFTTRLEPSELPRHRGNTVYLQNGQITLRREGKDTPLLPIDEILLPGRHNVENYMTAIGLTDGLVSADAILTVARSFKGVAHRLELVRTVGGVTYYNSSIDSTPTRTEAALSALEHPPIVICGGCDKHVSFLPLAKALKERAKAVVLTGETREKILAALREEGAELPVYVETDFRGAVERARSIAREGDTVLLSPACASFDAFRNFEERGETFRCIVNEFS